VVEVTTVISFVMNCYSFLLLFFLVSVFVFDSLLLLVGRADLGLQWSGYRAGLQGICDDARAATDEKDR
jgi:hypothetical protein